LPPQQYALPKVSIAHENPLPALIEMNFLTLATEVAWALCGTITAAPSNAITAARAKTCMDCLVINLPIL
jgi:hypothetical protein